MFKALLPEKIQWKKKCKLIQ